MTHAPQPFTETELGRTLREEMPVADEWAYFDHAAVGPVSRPAAEALCGYAEQSLAGGDTYWPAWAKGIEATRRQAAELIGATPREIALTPNTTAGITLVAEGIDWRAGDNVVILADEYPANVYAWLHQQDRGVETRRIPTDRGRPDLDQLRAACDTRTRVVSVSWVGYTTGYRNDLPAIADIAHSVGAMFFVDAIQGLGVFPIDVSQTPIDALAADGHKWLLSPEGAAIAYLREEWLDRLRPIGVGATSVVNPHDYGTIDYRLQKSARRYEGGTLNMPGMLALGAGFELLGRWSAEEVAAAVLAITDHACDRLQSVGATIASHRAQEPNGHDPRSGILAFELPGHDPAAIRAACLDAGVVVSCRGGRVRIAPHAYTNGDDVERLISVLESSK